MNDYQTGVSDERARIVNLIVSLIEDEEIRDWFFGDSCNQFFSTFGYDLIEVIESD